MIEAHYRPILISNSAKKLNQGTDIKFSVTLTDPTQVIACHVSCDEFGMTILTISNAFANAQTAGTLRTATLALKLPKGITWPKPKTRETPLLSIRPAPNSAKRRTETPRSGQGNYRVKEDEFGDGDLDDQDLLAAMVDDFEDEFKHIDDYGNDNDRTTAKSAKQIARTASASQTQSDWEPKKMANGKWSCNHRCKDRSGCKHVCCREGLDKPPKAPKRATTGDKNDAPGSTQQQKVLPKGQTTLSLSRSAKAKYTASAASSDVIQVDLTQEPKKALSRVPGEMKRLEKLHSKMTGGRVVTTPTFLRQNITHSRLPDSRPRLSFMPEHNHDDHRDVTSDYGDSWPDSDLPDLAMLTENTKHSTQYRSNHANYHGNDDFDPAGDLENFGDSDSLMNDAMVGLADSQELEQQTSRAPARPSRIVGSDEDDILAALEDSLEETSATFMPDTPKPSRKMSRRISDPFESSIQAHKRPREVPFIDASSALFVTPGSTLRRPGSSMDDDEFGVPSRKKVKITNVADKENELSLDPTPLTEYSDAEMAGKNEEHDAKAKREEIDAWFMQEFGQYVEFT